MYDQLQKAFSFDFFCLFFVHDEKYVLYIYVICMDEYYSY
jgi:hypothetical protein